MREGVEREREDDTWYGNIRLRVVFIATKAIVAGPCGYKYDL